MKEIFSELDTLWRSVNEGQLKAITNAIIDCKGNIICLGAGRMGYAVQSFSMRLSHLGFNAYMLGDTTLPRITDEDLIIINSSSGETKSIILLAELAKQHGGKLICVTSDEQSSLAVMSELNLIYEKILSYQLMKSAFEQFSFLLFDYIAQEIFTKTGKEKSWVENNHSILE